MAREYRRAAYTVRHALKQTAGPKGPALSFAAGEDVTNRLLVTFGNLDTGKCASGGEALAESTNFRVGVSFVGRAHLTT